VGSGEGDLAPAGQPGEEPGPKSRAGLSTNMSRKAVPTIWSISGPIMLEPK
jgi:hypothetical protein